MKSEIETKLKELLNFADENGLSEVSWHDGKDKISFRRSGAFVSKGDAQAPETTAEEVEPEKPKEEVIGSPVVGVFRGSNSKSRPPFVVEGDRVKHGDRLGIVECMKIPTDVLSLCDGEIIKILAQDGQPVEYGQPLFVVRPPSEE